MSRTFFAADDTEGYSEADLAILNQAMATILVWEGLVDPADTDEYLGSNAELYYHSTTQHICGELHDVWNGNQTAAELVAAFYVARAESDAIRDRWYVFTAYNTESRYGWGDKAEAEKMADVLNRERGLGPDDINLFHPEVLTDQYQIERLNSRRDDSGFNMGDVLRDVELDEEQPARW